MKTNPFPTTEKTYLAFIHHYRYRKTWGYRATTFGSLGVLLVFLLYFLAEFHTVRAIGALIATAILAIYFFVVLDYLFPIWGFRSARKRGVYAHKSTVHIDQVGISSVSADAELKKPWKSIEAIASTPQHIFIYFNTCAAFLIPRSVFDSTEDSESFLEAAKLFHASSQTVELA